MRTKTSDFLKVLNRARSQPKTTEKKTITLVLSYIYLYIFYIASYSLQQKLVIILQGSNVHSKRMKIADRSRILLKCKEIKEKRNRMDALLASKANLEKSFGRDPIAVQVHKWLSNIKFLNDAQVKAHSEESRKSHCRD